MRLASETSLRPESQDGVGVGEGVGLASVLVETTPPGGVAPTHNAEGAYKHETELVDGETTLPVEATRRIHYLSTTGNNNNNNNVFVNVC